MTMKISKLSLLPAIILASTTFLSTTYAPEASASVMSPGCQIEKAKKKMENILQGYCEDEEQINTEEVDSNAEEGEPGWSSWFFEIPEDQRCDLGLEFPDLIPDFDFGLGRINVCNVLQKVSANAVGKINEEFDRIENQVNDIENGVNDYGNIDLNDLAEDAERDLKDYFDKKNNPQPKPVRPPGG